jgi:peptidoglycan/LPS O-acetylase OafA/YrhL
MVLFYHTSHMLQAQQPPQNSISGMLWQAAEAGQFGVDLFFVLSGFLIGGLYWQERRDFDNVQCTRFILRRACRTMPPYFVALLVEWVGVRVSRGEKFEAQYIFFLQNYSPRIPYFLVSWSLCIEEHFYIVLPFLLALVCLRFRPWPTGQFRPGPHVGARYVVVILPLLAVVPAILRGLNYSPTMSPDFGYNVTATHFRFEGLILGVWGAFLFHFHRHQIQWLIRARVPIYFAAVAFVLAMPKLPDRLGYIAGYSVMAALLLAALLACAVDVPYRISRLRAIGWLAVTSYSVYLTHSMIIHGCLQCFRSLSSFPVFGQWLLMFAAIIAAGSAYYLLVEKPALWLRARVAPRRLAAPIHSAEPSLNEKGKGHAEACALPLGNGPE